MRRTDRFRACVATLLAVVASTTLAADTLLRHRADIVIENNAAFVKLPLPPSAYARTTQGGLQDVRVVDARGERVPFALLAPRPDEQQTRDIERAATLYPLPPRPAAGGTWASPVELTVDGDRISVKRRGNTADAGTAPTRSPGWLIDLGEHRRDDPWPHSVRLQWGGPGEFSAAYRIETSNDLREWRAGGGGQVMALTGGSGGAGALSQPLVPLPPATGRFVRLVWAEPGAAPVLTGAAAMSSAPRSVTLDAPTELLIDAVAEPGALTFDLGAPLPLLQIDLQLGAGTRVAPVRLQARTRADEAWQTLPGAVFYQFDSGGETRRSPPVALQRTVRYLRVATDERAAPLDAQQTRLRARAQLSSLVFAAQGQPPYALLAGSAQADAGALPLATLVPNLDEERPRFGRASLGAWSEVREAARQADAEQRRAALRPWLLWAVLLAGVAALAFMVWRLARGPRG